MAERLDTTRHDRDAAGMTYVYPVVSRRAGGVSVGINLNPNNACNWHCAYCQVPGLKRGSAPEADIRLLAEELERMLADILSGDFMRQRVPEGYRRLGDIAFSGNGEPTSCRNFAIGVDSVIESIRRHDLDLPLRLITNGSYMGKAEVQEALGRMAGHRGEVWIKVDAVLPESVWRINGVRLDAARLREQVAICSRLCPTWIQTCLFAWDGHPPSEAEQQAYLAFLAGLVDDGLPLKGVLLYGLARPSMQPEAGHLSPLSEGWMREMAARIEAVGLPVRLSL